MDSFFENKRFYIFDFDGVLVDSVEIKTEAFSALYASYGDEVVKRVITHHRKNGGMSRFDKIRHYHSNFLDEKLSDANVIEISNIFSSLVVEKVVAAREIPGASMFLDQHCTSDSCCILNSATPAIEVNKIVERRNLGKYFQGIYGSPDSKIQNIEAASGLFNIDMDEAVFFGDAKSDFEAALHYGIDFIGIGSYMKNYLADSGLEYMVFNNFQEMMW